MVSNLWSALALGVVFLKPDVAVERTLAGGVVQAFDVAVAADGVAVVDVDQGEADLAVTVRESGGAIVVRADAWDRGRERVIFAAAAARTYRIEVEQVAPGKSSVAYSLRLEPPRFRQPDDDRRMDAGRLATEGKQLFAHKDASSLRASIDRRRRALAVWRALGDERASERAALMGIGDALYRLSELEDARGVFREALALSDDDERSRAEILNNLGMLAWSTGAVFEARPLLEQAAAAFDRVRFPYGTAAVYTNLAILAWEHGDLSDALRLNTRARQLFLMMGNRNGVAYVDGNAAIVADALGRRSEGIRDLERAVRGFHEAHDRIAEGRALVRLARMRLAAGDRAAAVLDVTRSLPLIHEASERLAEGDAHETLGRAYAAARDWPAARGAYARAMTLFEAVGNRRGQSNVWHGLGLVALAEGDTAGAIDLLGRARDLRRAIGTKALEADTLREMAAAATAAHDLALASQCLEEAIAIVNTVRNRVFERQLRASYDEDVAARRYDAPYVDTLIARHRLDPAGGYVAAAFAAADRAKARGLLESVQEAWAGMFESGSSLVRRERDLRQRIEQTSWAIWTASERSGAGDLDRLREQLDALLREHEAAEADIRRTEPAVALALNPPPLDVAALQHDVLDGQSVLLEFVPGEARSYVWAVTRDTVDVVELPPRVVIESAARTFTALARSPEIVASDPHYIAAAAVAGRLLLAPVARWLGRRRVVLVVDGPLAALPWAALPMPQRRALLMNDHELFTIWSATSLMLMREVTRGRPPAPKLLAILADPVLSRSDPRVHASAKPAAPATDLPTRRLTRLPFSRDEAQGIAAATPPGAETLTALDFDASRARFVSGDLRQYRIVHVSTHASNDPADPALSAIVLSLVDAHGAPVDGFVRIQDVVHLDLKADLVVLSACSTGRETLTHSDGVSSLGQAMLAGGSRRVIVSHWDVDDAASAFMMARFYERLFAGGASPAEALRAAQASMRASRRFARPRFWAGWQLMGDDW